MEPIYVLGHRNPDTDSIVAAISYSALMNAQGAGNYIPCRLGHINDETSFLLDKFGFTAPNYISTVRTQVRDIEFDHPPKLDAQISIIKAWDLLQENSNASSLPIVDDNGHLFGMVTAGQYAANDLASIHQPYVEDVPVFNLLASIEGTVMNTDENVFDSISGEVVIALPTAGGVLQGVREGSIIVCGNQPEVVEKALALKASCIILCQTDLADRYRGISSPTCIIASPCDAYHTSRLIFQSIPVGRIAKTGKMEFFHLDDYLDDVRDAVLKSRYRSYAVLDENDCVVGTLGRFHLMRPKRKKVVLVDHNEIGQSVEGLDQADIVAIIDHHRLADVQTRSPMFMRNEPIGSTTSIVALMYQEHGLMPSPKLAGLMTAAILSDTVLFKSPTCTQRDR